VAIDHPGERRIDLFRIASDGGRDIRDDRDATALADPPRDRRADVAVEASDSVRRRYGAEA
jgi:hypothetical protein